MQDHAPAHASAGARGVGLILLAGGRHGEGERMAEAEGPVELRLEGVQDHVDLIEQQRALLEHLHDLGEDLDLRAVRLDLLGADDRRVGGRRLARKQLRDAPEGVEGLRVRVQLAQPVLLQDVRQLQELDHERLDRRRRRHHHRLQPPAPRAVSTARISTGSVHVKKMSREGCGTRTRLALAISSLSSSSCDAISLRSKMKIEEQDAWSQKLRSADCKLKPERRLQAKAGRGSRNKNGQESAKAGREGD
eukprot:343935-Rhodomonas_salina.1